jgi:HNH endonuclease
MSTARVSRRLREQVLKDAGGRCGYCQASEEITGTPLDVEHIVPESLGGSSRRENLWVACSQCNVFKSNRIAWEDGGALIEGRSETGRASVVALRLNRVLLVRARKRWIAVGWHPPQDSDVAT